MPVKKTLTAVLTARENVSGALNAIKDSALGAAGGLDAAAESANGAETAFDALERGGEGLAESLGDVRNSGVETVGSLDAVAGSADTAALAMEVTQGRADELGDEFAQATERATVLDATLASLPAAGALGGIVPFETEQPGGVNAPATPRTQHIAVAAALDASSVASVESGLDALTHDRTVEIETASEGFEGVGPLVGETVPIRTSLDESSATATSTLLDTLTRDRTVEIGTVVDGATGLDPTDDRQVDIGAAIDRESFAAVQSAVAETFSEEDVDIDPNADMSAFERVKSSIAGLFGRETVGVDADVDSASFAAAAAATEAIPDEKDIAIRANVDEASFARADAATAGLSGNTGGRNGLLGGRGPGLDIGPFNTSLGSLVAFTPGILGVGAALGGAATAAAGLGGVAGGAATGGLLELGKQANATSSDIDSDFEGVQQVLKDTKQQAATALQPLETVQNANIVEGLLGGGVHLLSDLSSTAAEAEDNLAPLGEEVSQSFWQSEPQFLKEILATTREFGPDVAGGLSYLLTNAPDLIGYLRTQTEKVLPPLETFVGDAIDLAGPLGEIGAVGVSFVLPFLSGALELVTPLVSAFSDLPDPIEESAMAAVAAGTGAYFLAGALEADGVVAAAAALGLEAVGSASALMAGEMTVAEAAAWGLDAALAVLESPIIIAALAAGAYVLADHFGLLDDITAGLAATWNALLGVLQWSANAFLNLVDFLKPILYFLPGLGQMLFLWDNMSTVVSVVEGAFHAVGKAIKLVGKTADKWLGPLDEWVGAAGKILGGAIGGAGDRGPGKPRVDLSGFKAGDAANAAKDANRGGPGRGPGGRGGGGPGGQQPGGMGGGMGGPGMGGYGGGYGSGYGGSGPPPGAAAAQSGGDVTYDQTFEYHDHGDNNSNTKIRRLAEGVFRDMQDHDRHTQSGGV